MKYKPKTNETKKKGKNLDKSMRQKYFTKIASRSFCAGFLLGTGLPLKGVLRPSEALLQKTQFSSASDGRSRDGSSCSCPPLSRGTPAA